MFNTGDIVHVPAETTLFNNGLSGNVSIIEHFVTTVPKKALYILRWSENLAQKG